MSTVYSPHSLFNKPRVYGCCLCASPIRLIMHCHGHRGRRCTSLSLSSFRSLHDGCFPADLYYTYLNRLKAPKLNDNKILRNDLETGHVAVSSDDPLIAAAHNRSTVFARWHQCVRPSNTRFLVPTSRTMPNGSSIDSAVFAWLMPHSSYTLHCAAPVGHAESVCNRCYCHIRHTACQATRAAGGRTFIAEQRLRHV